MELNANLYSDSSIFNTHRNYLRIYIYTCVFQQKIELISNLYGNIWFTRHAYDTASSEDGPLNCWHPPSIEEPQILQTPTKLRKVMFSIVCLSFCPWGDTRSSPSHSAPPLPDMFKLLLLGPHCTVPPP